MPKQKKIKVLVSDYDFIITPRWMWTKLGLEGKELNLFALVYGFSKDGKSRFHGAQGYMAEWLGCSRQTVNTVMSKLIEKNLVVKGDSGYDDDGEYYSEHYANIPYINALIGMNVSVSSDLTGNEEGVKGLDSKVSNDLTDRCQETLHNKDIYKDKDSINPPLYPPKGKPKKKGILSFDEVMEEVDKRSFSSEMRAKLCEWEEYKEERSPYKTIKGLNLQLSQLENTIKKYGDKAVLERIDEAMSREWVGWNFDTMDAFDKNRPYMQNRVQQIDKRPRYRDLGKNPVNVATEEQKKEFQERARELREKLKDKQN